MNYFSDKILFKMTLDEMLILLFVPTSKTMFVAEHFKYCFRKSFMSSIVATWKIITSTEFGFITIRRYEECF